MGGASRAALGVTLGDLRLGLGLVRNPLPRHLQGEAEVVLERNLFLNHSPSKDFHTCLFLPHYNFFFLFLWKT